VQEGSMSQWERHSSNFKNKGIITVIWHRGDQFIFVVIKIFNWLHENKWMIFDIIASIQQSFGI
jgi:hypothetical protein